jgi:hypothetical protein
MSTQGCIKCGATNLVWRKSVKGHWYLANPSVVGTKLGNYITIPFAHKCVAKKVEEPKSEAHLNFRRNQILEKQALHPEWMTQDDFDELERIEIQLKERAGA